MLPSHPNTQRSDDDAPEPMMSGAILGRGGSSDGDSDVVAAFPVKCNDVSVYESEHYRNALRSQKP